MAESKPQSRPIGYACVSTYEQTLDAQLEQLRGAVCTKIYREKVTAARADRGELVKMLKALVRGDVVTVTGLTASAEAPSIYSPSSSRTRAGKAAKLP
jgi:DNA invertase Pin-like site-specific DNA recombinase